VPIAEGLGLTTVESDFPSGDPDPHATRAKLIDYVSRMARPGLITGTVKISELAWKFARALGKPETG
jgi:hypothetical protein